MMSLGVWSIIVYGYLVYNKCLSIVCPIMSVSETKWYSIRNILECFLLNKSTWINMVYYYLYNYHFPCCINSRIKIGQVLFHMFSWFKLFGILVWCCNSSEKRCYFLGEDYVYPGNKIFVIRFVPISIVVMCHDNCLFLLLLLLLLLLW